MASISLKSVTLDFPLYGSSSRSFKKQLIRLGTGGAIYQSENEIITVRAIDNVSAELASGDFVGLIGHNGAGKSTLLRLLSGIYEPTAGQLSINGKVSSLLDLSLGLDPESTGYENIFIYGLIRGYSRKEILARSKEIIDFTELGDYISMPIRTYSDGMRLRLAFSLATTLSAQILILDEVVGAGDRFFMGKAQKRLECLVKESELVVFASHSEELIRQFCNKVMWLEAGRVVFFGDVAECFQRYNST
jgi:ABC-type polysaccharide/polyol phosphate transport system ATPase subunit